MAWPIEGRATGMLATAVAALTVERAGALAGEMTFLLRATCCWRAFVPLPATGAADLRATGLTALPAAAGFDALPAAGLVLVAATRAAGLPDGLAPDTRDLAGDAARASLAAVRTARLADTAKSAASAPGASLRKNVARKPSRRPCPPKASA